MSHLDVVTEDPRDDLASDNDISRNLEIRSKKIEDHWFCELDISIPEEPKEMEEEEKEASVTRNNDRQLMSDMDLAKHVQI